MPTKRTKLTPEEALVALTELAEDNSDLEIQHIQADAIVSQLLSYYLQDEVVDQYNELLRGYWCA